MGRGLGRCRLGPPGLDRRAILGVCGGHQSDLCMRESDAFDKTVASVRFIGSGAEDLEDAGDGSADVPVLSVRVVKDLEDYRKFAGSVE